MNRTASLGGANDPLNGAAQIIENRVYYKAFASNPKSFGSYTSIPSLSSSPSSKGRQHESQPQSNSNSQHRIHYFSIDSELVYWNFFLDFGPLNLGQLYRFCEKLNSKLNDARFANRIICFYSDASFAKRANAMYLISAWQVLFLDRSPEEACAAFLPAMRGEEHDHDVDTMDDSDGLHGYAHAHAHDGTIHLVDDETRQNSSSRTNGLSPRSVTSSSTAVMDGSGCTFAPIPPFHDASQCQNTYDLTILDCIQGLAKARHYNFFNFEDFDIQEYEHFEQVENGDLNWIVRNKFLAFAGPQYRRQVTREGCYTLTPSDYIPYFQRKNVGLVVRLNKKQYDENQFRAAGIDHYEKYYLDGSCPTYAILDKVLGAFEAVPHGRAIAVHCKAGLGRTGTCIGAYIMKHYKFTAKEVIGWMRICRPGMVIGPQQHFLQDLEQKMWYEGDIMRMNMNNMRPSHQSDKMNILPGIKSLSVDELYEPDSDAVKGRKGQADGLLERRAKHGQRDVRQH